MTSLAESADKTCESVRERSLICSEVSVPNCRRNIGERTCCQSRPVDDCRGAPHAVLPFLSFSQNCSSAFFCPFGFLGVVISLFVRLAHLGKCFGSLPIKLRLRRPEDDRTRRIQTQPPPRRSRSNPPGAQGASNPSRLTHTAPSTALYA